MLNGRNKWFLYCVFKPIPLFVKKEDLHVWTEVDTPLMVITRSEEGRTRERARRRDMEMESACCPQVDRCKEQV